MSSEKWKFAHINVEEIVPAKENANKMSDADFDQLVKNIKKSGGLSGAITCYKRSEDGKFVLISGHHRFRACVKLCYPTVPVVYADEADMDKDEIIALQLSHNSLHGEDNKGILKRLFDEIESIDYKEFAHINVDEIGSIDTFNASLVPLAEHYSVSFVLYKNDMNLIDELIGNVSEQINKSDVVILANQDNTEDMLMELSKRVANKYDIKSSHIAFSKILQLAKKQFDYENQQGLDSNDKS
ncbi:MAG: ParB N-terminal domain-containing protein [Paludibacteraceae bacterium]|nr:ParB N-terminal domain-containing protein [Paludibacteraceae bacterium]